MILEKTKKDAGSTKYRRCERKFWGGKIEDKHLLAYREGSLKEIFDVLIRPLLKYKREDQELVEFMKDILCTDTRSIGVYRCKKPFKIPGLYLKDHVNKIQGLGYRKVKHKQRIYIRHDTTQPGIYHVQFNGGVGSQTQIFELTHGQFIYIKRFIGFIK